MSSPSVVSTQHHDAIREISQCVLTELAPEEVEVALGFLDPMIELAAGGEVLPIDASGDHVGGFGGVDMLAVSIVPAVFEVLARISQTDRPTPSELAKALNLCLPEIEALVRRVGSQRALDRLPELTESIKKATLRHFARDRDL